MLNLDAIRNELVAIKAQTGKPFNVNFSCHAPPAPNGERESAWRTALSPYYKEYEIDADAIPVGPRRAPFSSDSADVLDELRPPVVSFHFGLPSAELLARVRACGARILSSATTVEEALARSSGRRCHHCPRSRGRRTPWHLLVGRPEYSSRHVCAVTASRAGSEGPGHRCWRHRGRKGRRGRYGAWRSGRTDRDELSALSGSHHERRASLCAEE